MKLMRLHKIGRGWLNASFANQITLFALSFSLGVSLLIGAGSYVALRAQIEAAIQHDLAAEANLVESRLSHFIIQAGAELEALSMNSFIANGLVDSQGRDGYLQPFLRDFRLSIPGKEGVSLTLHDFGGKPLIQVRPDKAIAADAELVGQAIATGKPQVRIITQGNETYFRLVQPIHFPPTQSVEGALAVHIRLAPLLAGTGIALAESQVLQLHAAGAVVAQIGASQQDVLRVERALKLDAPFDTLRLRLTLDSSTRDAQGPLDRLTLIYGLGLLLLLPLVGWVTHRVSRRMVAPLVQLSATAGAIASSGVITVPLQIGGSNEVGRLADDFGRMLARLGATQAELSNQTAGLIVSEARFANIVNLAADAIISVDEEQRILIFNYGAELIFGYTAAEMLWQPLERLLPERYTEAHRGHLRQFGAAPQAARYMSRRSDIFGRRKDGSEFFAEASISQALENGKHVFTVFLRDITERKQAEEEIRQLNAELETKVLLRTAELTQAKGEAERASRAKSQFLAAMSHEIRTPMNGVIGMTDVLQQSSLKGNQVEMVNIIHDSAFALLAIIDDILDFSKIEAGKLEIEQVPTSVAEVVEKACRMLDHLALKKNVELTLFTDPALPEQVFGDPQRLRQIVINLANNAIKFSSGQARPGRVSVRAVLAAREAGQFAVDIHVTDNGIGMDEATQARLFIPFTQGDVSTTRCFGGTGLGLSIAHNLAELMGGDISVQSTPGQGSTFTVHLPCEAIPEVMPTAAAPSPLAGLSCLAVGGADGLADDLAAYMAAAGARVERAPDLAAAGAHSGPAAPGPWVWLIDAGSAPPAPDALRALIDAHTAQHLNCVIVVGRGKRRLPRRQGADPRVFEIDANVLTRQSVENAVAIAAGLRSAQVEAPPTGKGAARLAAPPRADALRQGRLILVAEDNETNQKVIVQQLALLGYAADIADNGSEALKRWLSGDYALLLTDLHMPAMDGYELAAAIRDHEAGQRRIPILALTANALKGEAEHCRAVGMDDYLSKPTQLVELKAMLAKWLPAAAAQVADAVPDLRGAPTFATLDVSVLAALVGDDPQTIREFLEDFRASAATIAAELQAACAAGDAARASALAHKLKSSARSVGALPLGEICAEMEAASKAGDTAMLKKIILKFVDEMTVVDAALETLASRHENNDGRADIAMTNNFSVKIALVDDEPFMLKLLSRMLENLGYAAPSAHTSGRAALAAFAADGPPDLILLDLNMPEMDGIEFIRSLVETCYAGSLILVSGEDERMRQAVSKLVRAHHIRVLGHLQKTATPDALAALLEKWSPPTHDDRRLTAPVAYGAEAVRAAIANGELVNYYQPKVAVSSGAVVGVETLVRWRHPVDGLVFPDQFIGVAEAHDLIGDLTRVVLASALAQARAWLDAGLPLRVAVNLSMDNLAAPGFADYVAAQAADAGVAPAEIVLEVTESRLMDDLRAPLEILTRLRLKRFRLSIDDFGTGHSSLAQLRDLPFDELKIDRGFVHRAHADPTLRAIFESNLNLARQLGMEVVAEGVEDQADWDFLRQTGCDLAQGYFIARPMPAADLPVWIETWEARRLELYPA